MEKWEPATSFDVCLPLPRHVRHDAPRPHRVLLATCTGGQLVAADPGTECSPRGQRAGYKGTAGLRRASGTSPSGRVEGSRGDGGERPEPGSPARWQRPWPGESPGAGESGLGAPGSGCKPRALRVCFVPCKSLYERLSQRMLDISGDRGVLKAVIREGAGELVTPDASVLGTACGRVPSVP